MGGVGKWRGLWSVPSRPWLLARRTGIVRVSSFPWMVSDAVTRGMSVGYQGMGVAWLLGGWVWHGY